MKGQGTGKICSLQQVFVIKVHFHIFYYTGVKIVIYYTFSAVSESPGANGLNQSRL